MSSGYYGAQAGEMADTGPHFPGCHPEDARAPRKGSEYQQQATENCWHCGAPTPCGCNCSECWEGADYVPPSARYHCPVCKRWWAWMTMNITEITFGED